MDWTSGNFRTFVPVVPRPETSFDFLYNYDQFQGMEMMKQMHAAAMAEKASSSSSIGLLPGEAIMERNFQERKKRLTSDQLESLERSFQVEIKLDPERKMKLSRELGLQPRQIAVWFQNRRARWKSKQLELLYDSLKQEYDAISREKHKLQEEVKKLKRTLREEATRNNRQGITEVSGEETVESTSVAATRSSNKHQIADLFNVDDYNPAVSSPFWGHLPTNYQ